MAEPEESTEADLVVGGSGSRFTVRAGGMDVHCGRDDLPAQLEYATTQMLLAASKGFIHLHAAGGVHEGAAILAAGDSGAGKSSVALAWATAGTPVLGDDICFIDRGGMAHPFMRPFKADVERGKAVGIDLERTPYWHPGCWEIWFDPEETTRWGDPAPVGLVALLERHPEAPVAVDDVTPASAAQRLLHQFMRTGERGADWIGALFDLLERARIVRIRFSDSRDAAEALLELAEHQARG